jgi:hypothetical protein
MPGYNAAKAQDWDPIERSVVKVSSGPCRGVGKTSEGTGILIDYRGRLHVLTALHALQYNRVDRGLEDNPLCYNVESPHFKTLGFPENSWRFRMGQAAWAYDLALLEPENDSAPIYRFSPDLLKAPLGPLQNWPLRKFLYAEDVANRYVDIVNIVVKNGEDLVAYGYPAGSRDLIVDTDMKVTQHQAQSERLAAADHVIESTGNAEFGMSGGPVFTPKGELIGLLSGKRVRNGKVFVETFNIGLLFDWLERSETQEQVFVESSEAMDSFCFAGHCWTHQSNGTLKIKLWAWNAGIPQPARRGQNGKAWTRVAALARGWQQEFGDVEIPFFVPVDFYSLRSIEPDSFVWIYRSSDQLYPALFSRKHFEKNSEALTQLLRRCRSVANEWVALHDSLRAPRDARFRDAEPFYRAQTILKVHAQIWAVVGEALQQSPQLLAMIQSHRLESIWESPHSQGGLEKLKELNASLVDKNRACIVELQALVSD